MNRLSPSTYGLDHRFHASQGVTVSGQISPLWVVRFFVLFGTVKNSLLWWFGLMLLGILCSPRNTVFVENSLLWWLLTVSGRNSLLLMVPAHSLALTSLFLPVVSRVVCIRYMHSFFPCA